MITIHHILRPATMLGVFAFLALSSCETPPKDEKKKIINPNGDSELALAMRKTFEQTDEIRKSLEDGSLTIPEDYIENLRYFHSATPTDSNVKVAEYYGFVKAIEIAAERLESADQEKQQERYTQLLNACVQCHQQFCPGPIRRIKKLRLPTAP